MRPPTVDAREVAGLAREVLSTPNVAVERVPAGYGNENWRVTDADGRRYVLKVGPRESAEKWGASRRSYQMAAAAGVPVPRLVHFGVRAESVVRVYEWVDGEPASTIAHDPAGVVTLFADLGAALAALHAVPLAGFSSRLDDSAPSFTRWTKYVDYRLGHIRERCVRNDAVDDETLERALTEIAALARTVDDAARPTLCHRDLHDANLLVDERGALLAILDWDSAEAWDTAGEWFKLDWMLFPSFAGAEAAFDAAYRAVHPEPPEWDRRRRLVDLMETLNTVANAVGESWNAELEARARSRLAQLLGG